MNDATIERITVAVSKQFPSFGGGRKKLADSNPIASALKNASPKFAACVDIKEVVRFVLKQAEC